MPLQSSKIWRFWAWIVAAMAAFCKVPSGDSQILGNKIYEIVSVVICCGWKNGEDWGPRQVYEAWSWTQRVFKGGKTGRHSANIVSRRHEWSENAMVKLLWCLFWWHLCLGRLRQSSTDCNPHETSWNISFQLDAMPKTKSSCFYRGKHNAACVVVFERFLC